MQRRSSTFVAGIIALASLASFSPCSAQAQIDTNLCVFADRVGVDGERMPVSIIERGGLLFTSNGDGDLDIYDLSDASLISKIGSAQFTSGFSLVPAPTAIAINDTYLYVSTFGVGLEVFDISDPTSPVSVTVVPFGGLGTDPQNAAIADDTLYLADAKDLYTFDLTLPESPVFIGEVPLPIGVVYPELQPVGSVLYAADGDLLVYDISDPHLPTLVNTVSVPDFAVECFEHSNGLYVSSTTDGLLLYNITDPANPVLADAFSLPGGAGVIDAEGSTLYVASYDSLIHTVDVSDPLAPSIVRTTSTGQVPFRLEVKDGYAYTAEFFNPNGLVYYRVSGDAPPEPVIYETAAQGTLNQLAKQDNLLFRATDNEGVKIYDLSDPLNVQLVNTYGSTFDYLGVAVVGDLMVTTERTYGLRVVDISDLSSLTRLTDLFGADVSLIRQNASGDVYVDDFGYGVYKLDLTDPSSPVILDNSRPNVRVDDFVMDGTTAYIIEDNRTPEITILDLADPLDPVVLGRTELVSITFTSRSDIVDIAVSGDRVFLADENGYLWIGDISDPTVSEQFIRPLFIDENFRYITLEGNAMVLSGELMTTELYAVTIDGSPSWLGALDGVSDIRDGFIENNVIFGSTNDSIAIIDLAAACDDTCLADVNGDGMVSPTDFNAWINAFNNNLPACDQNSDGACTPTDFNAWIANYNAGCD